MAARSTTAKKTAAASKKTTSKSATEGGASKKAPVKKANAKKTIAKAPVKKSPAARSPPTKKATTKTTAKAAAPATKAKAAPAKPKKSPFPPKFLEPSRKRRCGPSGPPTPARPSRCRPRPTRWSPTSSRATSSSTRSRARATRSTSSASATSPCRRQARPRSRRSTTRCAKFDDGTYGICEVSGEPIPRGAARGDPVGPRARRVQGRRARPSLSRWPPTSAPRHRGRPARLGLVLASPAVVVVVDQLTKSWAVDRARPTGPIHVGRDAAVQPGPQHRRRVQPRPGGPRAVASSVLAVVVVVVAGLSSAATGPTPAGRGRARRWSLGGALGNLARPRLPRRRRVPARPRWSTSSTCSGGRCSTSPTRASWSARSCCCVIAARVRPPDR